MQAPSAPDAQDRGRAAVDLVIVGSVTIDRFADGGATAGGSALHGARAAAASGYSVGIVTQAGDEPTVSGVLDELRALAAWVERTPGPTWIYGHAELGQRRILRLEQRGGRIDASSISPGVAQARSLLVAPIGAEVSGTLLRTIGSVAQPKAAQRRGAALQGWLRRGEMGDVKHVPLAALPLSIAEPLRDFDLLLTSTEDVPVDGGSPSVQLSSLRSCFGAGPALVLTDGVNGAWLSPGHGAGRGNERHVPVPSRIPGTPTVGAGDMLAALLLADGEWDQADASSLERSLAAAMKRVAELLAERHPSP